MPLPEMIRIPEDDYEQRRELLANGWREIEVLETYEGQWHGKRTLRGNVRNFEPTDRHALMDIAGKSFEYDRLHVDKYRYADMAKIDWLVGRMDCRPGNIYVDYRTRGFITFEHFMTETRSVDGGGFVTSAKDIHTIEIDLIAVADDSRGMGVARDLVMHAASGKHIVRAGTQMHNEPARALYKSLGMSVVKMERTFHR
jgi:ribosomal protein S18 acetylase RimI-like enzyme